jgi:hypothetical protein
LISGAKLQHRSAIFLRNENNFVFLQQISIKTSNYASQQERFDSL